MKVNVKCNHDCKSCVINKRRHTTTIDYNFDKDLLEKLIGDSAKASFIPKKYLCDNVESNTVYVPYEDLKNKFSSMPNYTVGDIGTLDELVYMDGYIQIYTGIFNGMNIFEKDIISVSVPNSEDIYYGYVYSTEDWIVNGQHTGNKCTKVVIINTSESILLKGMTYKVEYDNKDIEDVTNINYTEEDPIERDVDNKVSEPYQTEYPGKIGTMLYGGNHIHLYNATYSSNDIKEEDKIETEPIDGIKYYGSVDHITKNHFKDEPAMIEIVLNAPAEICGKLDNANFKVVDMIEEKFVKSAYFDDNGNAIICKAERSRIYNNIIELYTGYLDDKINVGDVLEIETKDGNTYGVVITDYDSWFIHDINVGSWCTKINVKFLLDFYPDHELIYKELRGAKLKLLSSYTKEEE